MGMALAAVVAAAGLAPGQAGGLILCALLAGGALLRLAGEKGRLSAAPPLIPLLLFALGVAAVLLGASPMAPGGVHPLWSLIGRGGAAAIDLQAEWLGLLAMLALGLAFWLGCSSGAPPKTVRSVTEALMATGLVVEATALMASLSPVLRGSSLFSRVADPGFRGAFFGVMLILAAEGVLRALSAQGPGGWTARLRAAPLSVATILCSALLLAMDATPPAAVICAVVVILQVCWSLLLGGGRRATPRRVLLWLAPATAGLAAAIAAIAAEHISENPAAALARQAHWQAFWSAPWMGYGLGSVAEVGRLIMTRLNLSAISTWPGPPQAYLAWFEQGGLLAALPLLGAIAWTTVILLWASLAQPRLAGLMCASVCTSLFLALLGLASAGPADFSIEALWIFLLGLGFGAARSI